MGGKVNIYRHKFVSVCPNNGKVIFYELKIETDKVIQVEHIVTAVKLHDKGFHEEIADSLHKQFGGKQTMVAQHHGVDIETRRGFE